jgi:hypothetical protein
LCKSSELLFNLKIREKRQIMSEVLQDDYTFMHPLQQVIFVHYLHEMHDTNAYGNFVYSSTCFFYETTEQVLTKFSVGSLHLFHIRPINVIPTLHKTHVKLL